MNILIVSHDAGGAGIISAYVKKNLARNNFFCIVDGPAVNIFKLNGLEKYFYEFNGSPEHFFDSNQKIDLVLVTISWSSTLEQNFLKAAKRRGIKTAVYLDHWVNYRERFGYPRADWQDNLSDEIWVGDEYAYQLAKDLFGNTKIKLVPNISIANIKREYKNFVKLAGVNIGKNILFLSEPISAAVNTFGDKGKNRVTEFQILDQLLSYFARHKENRVLVIRFHPSEGRNKYDKILSKYKNNLSILKSKNSHLLLDIIEADLIIGIESMALATAVLCGKRKVISFMPENNFECHLPFESIIKIKNVDDLAKVNDI